MQQLGLNALRLQYGDGEGLAVAALLGAAWYGATAGCQGELPSVVVPMAVLPHGGAVHTAWFAPQVGPTGWCGRVRYRYNGDLLFGCIALHEADFTETAERSGLQQASFAAYAEIFATLQRLGFAHLARCWNYLPGINRDGGGLERYRQFNIGRQDAFIAARSAHEVGSPAACALGVEQGALVVYFLASRRLPVAIENPRQVSAYRYPSEYGPRSPTFSRASLLTLGDGEVLFISGTASIVGHASVHLGDVVAQTEETLRNIDTLVAEANRVSRLGRFATQALYLKAFIRHAEDYPKVAQVVTAQLGVNVHVLYLQADICRAELLVEIEATGFCQETPVA